LIFSIDVNWSNSFNFILISWCYF